VLLLSAEDDAAVTIRPRLDAVGADLTRFHILDAMRCGEDERPPVLPFDLDVVEDLIRKHFIGLVIIDPFMAYLAGEVNAHRDQDVRRAMHRLKMLAEKTGVGIVIVRHLNKQSKGPALYRGGGSIGIIGAVRSGLLVGRDPADETRRVLASNKCNLAAKPRSLAYDIEPHDDVSRVRWLGECDLTADDILGSGEKDDEPGGKRYTAADAVRELLASGPMPCEELDSKLEAMGLGRPARQAGKRDAGVQLRRPGGFTGPYEAYLPPPGTGPPPPMFPN
jgi:hypothetical protein